MEMYHIFTAWFLEQDSSGKWKEHLFLGKLVWAWPLGGLFPGLLTLATRSTSILADFRFQLLGTV